MCLTTLREKWLCLCSLKQLVIEQEKNPTDWHSVIFRSLDVFNFGAPFIRYITFEDMDQIIDLIHFYIYGSTGMYNLFGY